MLAALQDPPTHATERVGSRGRGRVRAHAYLRERALPRALGQVWPSAGGCKTASRKKFLSKRRVSRVRCARVSTEPREFAIVLIIIVSGQTVNRFAYVMNNPLSYTDPSGYFSWKKLFRGLAAIAVAWFAPQFLATYGIAGASPALAGFVNAAATGFLAGAVSSGSLKGAIISAFTAGLFDFAGGIGAAGSPERYLAHAAAGCVSSVAGGGKCGSGIASAVFGKYTTNWMNDTFGKELSFGRGVATAIAGGVGSVIGGGKFESGAVTAAFGYLFNECGHGGCGFGTRDAYSGSSPLLDGNGRLVSDARGQSVLIPEGFDVNRVFEAAADVRLEQDPAVRLRRGIEDLAKFKQGGEWDLQRLSGGRFDGRYVDAATVLIGAYSNAAGISMSNILTVQNTYARLYSRYPAGTQFSSEYTNLPERNVRNTVIGYQYSRR
jgi:hypothetical protein